MRAQYMLCTFCFYLQESSKNELDLSLYSLSPKTSRYEFSDDNRLIAFGIRFVALCYRYNKYLNFRTSGMPLSKSS